MKKNTKNQLFQWGFTCWSYVFCCMTYIWVYSLQWSTLWYTTFFVLLSCARINKADGLPTREYVMYNWLWKKHAFSKFRSQKLKDCPCDLLIAIVNAIRIGNLIRLNSKSKPAGIIEIFRVRTSSHWWLIISFLTTKRVPLHSYSWFKFRSMMTTVTTEPAFSCKLCAGTPGISKEFKN